MVQECHTDARQEITGGAVGVACTIAIFETFHEFRSSSIETLTWYNIAKRELIRTHTAAVCAVVLILRSYQSMLEVLVTMDISANTLSLRGRVFGLS
jgi:hypothetical protein